eukprot:Blabericola_migrator_1__10465@NODE_5928_length_639_cov_42_863636_g3927_i0_p1_GENE_NODE_5928_length_639_cov_42_863636_g3927_i0NODE_5928_length_639_cov_42_863636_g3927_i0_p1_ORF_typecomplete_len112_score6_80_NODE_5928_length_639_cov_42_863636_g3927_i03338
MVPLIVSVYLNCLFIDLESPCLYTNHLKALFLILATFDLSADFTTNPVVLMLIAVHYVLQLIAVPVTSLPYGQWQLSEQSTDCKTCFQIFHSCDGFHELSLRHMNDILQEF